MINWLYNKSEKVLENKVFTFIVDALIFLNPLALAPQLWTIFRAPSVEGISLLMWVIFSLIQIAMAFEGVHVKSKSMFYSMSISAIESITVIIVVLIRT